MLERIRIKYNIDKSRAEELEKTLIQGTAEEEEFRTAVREYLKDGELTEKDNALLARLAIASERAEELKKFSKGARCLSGCFKCTDPCHNIDGINETREI